MPKASLSFNTATRAPRKKIGQFDINKQVFYILEPSGSAKLFALNWAARLGDETLSMEDKQTALGALVDFLGACMSPQQYEVLYKILVSPEQGLSIEEVAELAVYVVELSNEPRPTKPSTGSPAGRSATGRTASTGGSRSRASTRTRSRSGGS